MYFEFMNTYVSTCDQTITGLLSARNGGGGEVDKGRDIFLFLLLNTEFSWNQV